MSEQNTLEIHAEASGHIAATQQDVWQAVADLSRRPNLKISEPLAGVWPDEGARVRTIMSKGEAEMARTETVIRCVPQERLVLKIEAPDWGSTGWLDHRIDASGDGWRLTIGVIAIADFPEGMGPKSRHEYWSVSQQALEAAVDEYRKRIETAAS